MDYTEQLATISTQLANIEQGINVLILFIVSFFIYIVMKICFKIWGFIFNY